VEVVTCAAFWFLVLSEWNEDMFFLVEDLLNPEQIENVEKLILRANFVDGVISARSLSRDIKNNREMQVSECYASLAALLDHAITSSTKINVRLLPRFRTNPIFNRYDVGMFYAEHTDAPIQGGVTQFGRSAGRFGQNFLRTDYSMTLFLTDPASYDGGELQLQLFGESKLVKLRAGSAVCYSTGLPHSVRPVTRGFRIAAVYWFQSLIRSAQIRSVIWEQYLLEEALRSSGQLDLASKAESIRSNLVRYTAEI
jgi:PKHD-type hydroxylase